MNRILVSLLLWMYYSSVTVSVALPDKSILFPIKLSQETSGTTFQMAIPSSQVANITCVYQGYQNPDIIWISGSTIFSTETHREKYASASSLTVLGSDIYEQGQKITCETSGLKENLNVTVNLNVIPEDSESFDIEISPNNVDRNIPFHVSGTKMVQINCVIQDEETKTTSPGYLPSDSGSSTLENVEPELGNDDVDALKILVIVLIVVSVIFLVFLLILVIYISTNGNCFKHSVSITLENSKQKSGD